MEELSQAFQKPRKRTNQLIRVGAVSLFLMFSTLVNQSKVASADVIINAPQVNSDLIQRWYDYIPNAWKGERHIIVVEYDNRRMDSVVREKVSGLFARESTIDGIYVSDMIRRYRPSYIYLRKKAKKSETAASFVHEYGHYVWNEVLTKRERDTFSRRWDNDAEIFDTYCHYSTDSPEEAFAESFSYFIRMPWVVRSKDPVTYKFLLQAERSRN